MYSFILLSWLTWKKKLFIQNTIIIFFIDIPILPQYQIKWWQYHNISIIVSCNLLLYTISRIRDIKEHDFFSLYLIILPSKKQLDYPIVNIFFSPHNIVHNIIQYRYTLFVHITLSRVPSNDIMRTQQYTFTPNKYNNNGYTFLVG